MNIRDLEIDTLITFKSKNPNDLTEWRGTLNGIGNYALILSYGNPAAYHQAVRQTDPSVPISEKDLTYFLITVDNSANQPTLRVFAAEWLEAGSLAKINLGNKVTIEVMDSKSDTQAILALLASAGYASKIITTQ